MFGINGTFFNRDKGYNIPPNLKEPKMPLHDPNIPSKLQMFLSNYLLETFAATFLEKKPFVYELKYSKLNNKIAPFTSTTFEAVFPFLTSRFGKHIPMDLVMKIKKVYDVECFADNKNVTDNSTYKGMISLKLDIDCEGRLLYPNGVNKTIGKAEWTQVILKVNIIQTKGTIFSV